MLIAELLNAELPSCRLGEGPHWDSADGHLYWVDIKDKAIHRYHLDSKTHESCKVSSSVGFAIPDRRGRIIAGLKDGLYSVDFKSGEEKRLISPDMPKSDRFNDGKCDSAGRLWAGTMNESENPAATGKLYSFDGKNLTAADTGFKTANGKGWSPDQKAMYHADTDRQTIWRYDFNLASGHISNRAVFTKIEKDDGFPDGLCVDQQGNVYVSLFSGGKVRVFSSDGYFVSDITVPAPQVTSCTFGGQDLKTLFITTAQEGLSNLQSASAPLSGQIFICHMQYPGLPSYPFGT